MQLSYGVHNIFACVNMLHNILRFLFFQLKTFQEDLSGNYLFEEQNFAVFKC